MRRYSSFLIIAFFLFFLPYSSSAEAVEQQSNKNSQPLVEETIQNTTRVNVLFNKQIDYKLLKKYNSKVIQSYQKVPAITIEIQSHLIDSLLQEQSIQSVKEDQVVKARGQVVNWGHTKINLPDKYPSSLTGKGVKIGIIDSGIDYNHPDLKVAGGKCVLDLIDNPDACARSYYDDDGHGTHVAGIIAAQDNDIGVLGVAPGASIYGIKALNKIGVGTTSSIMAALDWAMKNNMDIINMSLTYSDEEPAIREFIKKAYNQGILIIAAGGNKRHPNGNENNVQFPGKYPEVIAVSSLGKNNDLLATSSMGNEMELTAPGELIYSTLPTSQNSYGNMSGTSMAAPFVTGVAALYMEKYPELDNVEIRELLQLNAKDLGSVGRDVRFGYGLVQVDSVVSNKTNIAVEESADSVVNISVAQLPEKATGYNLYRFDKKIISNGTDRSIKDFGSKGKIRYKLVPLINGKEDLTQAKLFHANLLSPVVVDMKNDYWFSRNVMYLKNEKIMNGYASGEIKPFQNITRAEAVILLVNALGIQPDASDLPFKDVTKDSVGAAHIGAAVKNGILKGFSDGTFRGQQAVTRAEMSIMIASGFQLSPAKSVNSFKDVNPNVTGYEQINRMTYHKIAAGFGDGTFRPYEKMTRGTYAVFLSKAKNEKLK
ncbi:S8 family peptidase [Bacillus massiliigorillae]|uniref:S8 family peptidase n=1 Tax=Bacillus massiliigorillae TaxID=1243664 RepID=UPI00069330E3|nr:S8 family serine peptidase [Bacillus massiliigorillae]